MQPWTQADLAILTGNVQRPNGIAWHNNFLYVVCTGDSTIYQLDDSTAVTRTYIFGVRNAHTMYAENLPNGELNLWVPDFPTNRLLRIDRNGVEAISSALAGPWGIERLDDDEFLITNLQANNAVRINRSGESSEILANLRSPTGIVSHNDYLYVANTGSARRAIEWVHLDEALNAGETPLLPQPLVSGLQNTTGLVMAEDGYLYFAYALGTRGVVGRVDPDQCRNDGGCGNDQVEIVVYTELTAPLAGLTISPDLRLFVHTMFSPDIYWVQLHDPRREEIIDD
jgi:sugar lactone lactonase YvrE